MNSGEKLIFTCSNPDCGRKFKMTRPQKGGIYKVSCPYCARSLNVEIPAAETPRPPKFSGPHMPPPPQPHAAPPKPKPKPKPQPKPQQPQDFSHKQPIEFDQQLTLNQKYLVDCPHCGKKGISYTPAKTGRHIVSCPACKGKMSYLTIKPTWIGGSHDIVATRPVTSTGKLTLLRKHGKSQEFSLREGAQTVGRNDQVYPSDININDEYMSRQSIEIVMLLTNDGYKFSIEVKKCTNPVLLNGKVIAPGFREYLTFGDIIVLGNSTLRLDKAF